MTAAALPFAALPLALGGVMPAAAAAELIPDGRATVLHHGPTPWSMENGLGGALCEAPKICREVAYDWIISLGPIEFGVQGNVRRLNSAIKSVGTSPKIVYAFSGGAWDAAGWLDDHADDLNAPDPDDLSFVLTGNGGRKYGGSNTWLYGDLLATPTDTQYDVLDIAREYDPIADFPANPFNVLAYANAVAAFISVHLEYDEVDLDDPDNIVWKEGNTTYVFAKTEHLPLLQGFYDWGLGSLVEDLEPGLKKAIDKAYNRTWLEGKEPQGEVNTLNSTQEESRSALTSFLVADGDEGNGDDDSVGATGDKKSWAARLAATGAADDAGKGSIGDVTQDPGTDDPETAETEAGTAAGEVPAVAATGDTDDSVDATDGKGGDDGDGAGSTAAGGTPSSSAAAGDTPTGGKHRAPRHGIKKVTRSAKVRGAGGGVFGRARAVADSAKSSNSSTSPSSSDSDS